MSLSTASPGTRHADADALPATSAAVPEVTFGRPAAIGPAEAVHVPRQLARPVVWRRSSKLTPRWILLGLAMTAVAVVASWRSWVDIWEMTDIDGENSHVFLAPLVVFWLLWVRRGRLPYVRVTGRWVGPIMIVLGWTLAAFGMAENIAAAFHLGGLLIAAGAFVSACGKQTITRFMPAAFALLFLIPVPQQIRDRLAVPLQTTTAMITDGILDAVGVESFVSGNTLVVNGRSVMIAEACNGMPMVFGLLLVTYAFAFAWPMRNWVRWLLLLLSPVVTLACNVLRTVPLVWTYATQSREAADWLHTYSGWAMLPVAFLVLLMVIRGLRWFDVPVERYRLASQ